MQTDAQQKPMLFLRLRTPMGHGDSYIPLGSDVRAVVKSALADGLRPMLRYPDGRVEEVSFGIAKSFILYARERPPEEWIYRPHAA